MRSLIKTTWIFGFAFFSSLTVVAQTDTAVSAIDSAKVVADRVGGLKSRGMRKTEVLNQGELKKAACCTISESFETSNTVEVSNADGISGVRQIEMLGLAGKYILLTSANIPLLRGLPQLNGLSQIPGPLVNNIFVAKGTGSVTNGYEGQTGGIDYTFKTTDEEPRLFLNGYVNNQGRTEFNLAQKSQINARTRNHVLLHQGAQWFATDFSNDGYADQPLYQRLYFQDQLHLQREHFESQLGVTLTEENKKGGQLLAMEGNANGFLFEQKERRLEAFGKLGVFLSPDGSRSWGNIVHFTSEDLEFNLGNLHRYQGSQNSFSYTGLFADKWRYGNLKFGVQTQYDQVRERYSPLIGSPWNPERNEWNNGVFGEVTLEDEGKYLLVIGLRGDYNNLYGFQFTPRTHLKIDLTKKSRIHVQAGVGRRTPWVFAEILPLLTNGRMLHVEQVDANYAYGLPQEKSVNLGVGWVKEMMMFRYPASINIDIYHTYFYSQIMPDREMSRYKLMVESQSGNSATSAQIDWNFRLHKRMEVKASYRFIENTQWLGGKKQMMPFISRHRAIMVLDYQTRNKWFFDLIAQWNGKKRIPGVGAGEPAYEGLNKYSKPYTIINLMVRKQLKKWEIYGGVENLLNVYQTNPVLNGNTPQDRSFDATMVWGPTSGIAFVGGFRFTLK